MTLPLTVLPMAQGLKVVVPNSLSLITPYVLYEQGDWFEDEIKFIRKVLEPSNVVVDIGANYGLYTLSMAQIVGATGHVLAIEPAPSTAACLEASLQENQFDWVTLDQVAVSDHEGIAHLTLNDQSELNELVRGDEADSKNTQEVPLVTLDGLVEKHGLTRVDFIKIDAEGEEERIVAGGAKFFSVFSPLVQFEVKAGNDVHLELVEVFAAMGYVAYQLMLGLSALVPFDPSSSVDGYLLNLFCCKPDVAQRLEEKGFLVQEHPNGTGSRATWRQLIDDLESQDSSQLLLHRWPYAQSLSATWDFDQPFDADFSVGDIVSLMLIAQTSSVKTQDRAHALDGAKTILSSVPIDQLPLPLLMSLARTARDLGQRTTCVFVLKVMIDRIAKGEDFDVHIPFLALDAHYQALDPQENIEEWVFCQVLEEYEKNRAFSSYYSGPEAKELLMGIQQLGFGSLEMARRLELFNLRYPDGVAGVTEA